MPKKKKPQPPADWKEHAKQYLEELWRAHNLIEADIAIVARIIRNDEAEVWYQFLVNKDIDASEPPEEEKP